MQDDVLREHIVGGIEEGDVRTYGVSPRVCRPVLWRLTCHVRTVAHKGIIDIYVYRRAVTLCLPVAWHCYLVPLADIVVSGLKTLWTFLGIGRPTEMPLSVERDNLLTLPLERGQLERGVIGQFVDSEHSGILPVTHLLLLAHYLDISEFHPLSA